MTQTEAAKRAAQLRKDIGIYSNAYYVKDAPLISDAAYDALLLELRTLEETYPDIVVPDSPTQKVGGFATSTFAKVTHVAPLQSLRDIFSVDDVIEWYDKYPNQTAVTVEPKVDGLSCALTYIDGTLTQGATRGDGKIGEDVTANIRNIVNIPTTIPLSGKVIIRGEVYMPKYVFEQLNHDLQAQGKRLFKNPRNAAAGSLRTKDAQETGKRGLHFIAFAVLYADPQANKPTFYVSQSETLNWLQTFGFETVRHSVCQDATGIKNAIETIDQLRDTFLYAIDGAVVKIDDIATQKTIGGTDKYPHWAIAYKYPPEQKRTILRDIMLQTGRTGVITPVAVFDPVELAGTTVTKATLHNIGYIDVVLGGIAVGDTITVHKSGEIIPEVLSRDRSTRPTGVKDFEITHCPVCGARAFLGADDNGNGTQMYCDNPNCPAQLQKHFEFFAQKDVMNIKGLGPKQIEQFIAQGWLQTIPDIYRLSEHATEMMTLPGFGPASVNALLKAIDDSKHNDIDRLIKSLGIPGVGRHIGKALAKKYKNVFDIGNVSLEENGREKKLQELSEIEGIGAISANAILTWFDNNLDMLLQLSSLGVNMISQTYQQAQPENSADTAKTGKLNGLTIAVTGAFSAFKQNEVADIIETNGGKCSSSVSKKTTYLLVGEAPGSKLAKAQALGIPTITEEEFLKMIQ